MAARKIKDDQVSVEQPAIASTALRPAPRDGDRSCEPVPGGNPAPDFATGPREGENLYSGPIVVFDAMTGTYRAHFKLVPKYWHDWDASTAPALIHTRAGRKLLAAA